MNSDCSRSRVLSMLVVSQLPRTNQIDKTSLTPTAPTGFELELTFFQKVILRSPKKTKKQQQHTALVHGAEGRSEVNNMTSLTARKFKRLRMALLSERMGKLLLGKRKPDSVFAIPSP